MNHLPPLLLCAVLAGSAVSALSQEITPNPALDPSSSPGTHPGTWLTTLFGGRATGDQAPTDGWPVQPPLGSDLATLNVRLMDTNGDGYVSHEEFAAYYETLYKNMKKSPNGMVSVKDLVQMRAAAAAGGN